MAEAPPASRRRTVLVTGNPSKLVEARRLFPQLEAVEIDLVEIQSLDLHEVLRQKARAAAERVDRPVVVEETGLELPALGGFPGPLVKWMLQAIGPEGIARLVAHESDTRATARCALLYLDGETEVVGEGHTEGELVLPARGDRGFGWDPVFRPEGSERTYGEMAPEEKDAISHRGRAWRAFRRTLAEAGVEL